MTINSKAGNGLPSTRHTYALRKQIGFDVELALSALGEPHQVELDDQGGAYDLEVITTPDPLASLRAESAWSVFAVTPGVPTIVPLGVRKLAVQITAINSDAPKPTVKMVTLAYRGTESARYYGVDQPTLPVPVAPAGLPVPFTWYDFSDITTLFQDEAGTVPVTANGQEVRHIANKGNGTSNPITSGVALGSTWIDNWTNGLGSLLLDAGKTIGGNQVDVSTSNGGWTWFGILSNKVSNDFASIQQSVSTSKTNITNVSTKYTISLRAALFTFSDYVIQVDTPVAVIGSLQSDATAKAIMSKSTEIKSGDGSTFQEIAQFDQVQLGAGLFGGVNHGEIRVWDELVDFELIKTAIFDKWGISFV